MLDDAKMAKAVKQGRKEGLMTNMRMFLASPPSRGLRPKVPNQPSPSVRPSLFDSSNKVAYQVSDYTKRWTLLNQ